MFRKHNFQLWATLKCDIYLMQNYFLMHWSSLLRRDKKKVLNVVKSISPTLVHSYLVYQMKYVSFDSLYCLMFISISILD